MVADWGRGAYARPPQWQPERGVADHLPEDARLYHPTTSIRAPPDTIHNALRERCHLPVKSYFCAVITDDDDIQIFSSLENLPDEAIPKFFSKHKFEQIFQRRAISSNHGPEDPSFPFNDPYYGDGPDCLGRRRVERRRDHRLDRSDDDLLPTYNTRKRQRATLHRRGPEDDDPPLPTRTKRSINVGDADALWEFYGQRFKGIQQNACKLIAKAWVKAVAPKKQTNNPYTAGDEKAPDWWPKPWGTTKEDKVRHIEPDHLLKKERVHLLIHILRMIIEPNATQHPDIQKLNINVAKLEEVTTDALSSFFNDNDKNNNSKKKPYLREIFKVAKAEEQYKRNEIDANTKIYVMADDKIPDNYQSDDEMYQVKEDEANGSVGNSDRVSPPKTAAPHSIMSASSSVHSPVTNLHGAPFMGDMPLRGPQYPSAMMPSDLATGQHSYVEGENMGVASQSSLPTHGPMHMQDMMPSPHDPSRRPSLYNSPATEFPSPPGTGLYANTWQQQTTAPGSGGLYAFPPQQPPPQPGSFVGQPGVSLGQGPPYLGSSFNGLPHPQPLADVYRHSPVSQSPVGHGSGYQYLGHDGRPLPHGLKMDPPNRGSLHQ